MARIVVPTPNTTITSAWGRSVADALNDLYTQAASQTITTDAAGHTSVTFPVAFQAVKSWHATAVGPPTTATPFAFLIETLEITRCVFRVYQGNTPYLSNPLGIVWTATGTRA